jgi:hypothetical protein
MCSVQFGLLLDVGQEFAIEGKYDTILSRDSLDDVDIHEQVNGRDDA